MKTYEFIDALESRGYTVRNFTSIGILLDGKEIATVWPDKPNSVATFMGAISSDLFDLIVEYARTPVEDRKYTPPNYIEHEYQKFFVGRKYYMGRYNEVVVAELAFGQNLCANQPAAFSTMPGLRGPAAAFAMQDTPDNFGFYWKCDATENYAKRTLAFLDLFNSTYLEDTPFGERDLESPIFFSEVKEAPAKVAP